MTPPRPHHGERWAFFLDVDGTLIEIAETPTAVSVPPGIVELLRRLHAGAGGAVALVSGRRIAELDRLFAPLILPAAGLHGAERRRADGRVVRAGPPPRTLDPARRELGAFAARAPGVLLEDKGSALALHVRGAPERETEARRLVEAVARTLDGAYRVQPGKMVVELKPAGAGKDVVVDAFLAEPPFAGRRPVFCGDDATDEDGFHAVNARDGVSVRVANEPRPATEARWSVESVPALRQWLEGVAEVLRPGGGEGD